MRGVEPDHVLDLLLDAVGVGGGQVDLVEHRQDLEVVVERLVDVGERLRLDALAASTTRRAPSQAASERDTS